MTAQKTELGIRSRLDSSNKITTLPKAAIHIEEKSFEDENGSQRSKLSMSKVGSKQDVMSQSRQSYMYES